MEPTTSKARLSYASLIPSAITTSSLRIEASTKAVIQDTKKLDYFLALLDECIRTHDCCKVDRELRSTIRDLRVIDCTQRKVVVAPPECKYFALSYVWGEGEQPCTLDGCLPQTIEDSISTVLYLGYRYLWIDRFCIDQNESHKHNQLQQMGAIYATAEVTLIAAAGVDPYYGLPGISKGFSAVGQSSNVATSLSVVASRWSTRGWTLQEDFLSRRRLFFTDAGFQTSCSKSSHTMPGSYFYDTSARLRTNVEVRSTLGESEELLAAYTARELSYDSDALNAIIGVFNTFRKRYPEWNQIWGVPYIKEDASPSPTTSPTIRMAIDWSGSDLERRPEFPSWSPLGWKSPFLMNIKAIPVSCDAFLVCISHGGLFEELSKLACEGRDVHTGTPETRCIQLTAYSIDLLEVQEKIFDNIRGSRMGTLQVTDKIRLSISIEWTSKDHNIMKHTSLLAVFKSDTSGLGFILQSSDGLYERVGTFAIFKVQIDGYSFTWGYNKSDTCIEIFHSKTTRIKKKTIIWV